MEFFSLRAIPEVCHKRKRPKNNIGYYWFILMEFNLPLLGMCVGVGAHMSENSGGEQKAITTSWLFLSPRIQELDSGHQALWQVLLPPELPSQTRYILNFALSTNFNCVQFLDLQLDSFHF